MRAIYAICFFLPPLFLSCLFLSCASTIPLKKISQKEPRKIEIQTLAGNENQEHFSVKSKIKVYKKSKPSPGHRGANAKANVEAKAKAHEVPQNPGDFKTLSEEKLEEASFKLNRKTLHVENWNKIQYRYWVSELKGEVDLMSMGFPPQGKFLFSAINIWGQVLAVRGMPSETVFYLPRVPLPLKPVKVGDVWYFKKQWRSLKTGWPFVVELRVVLRAWYNCSILNCAHITYRGRVILPESNPMSGGILESSLKGEFVYAPLGDQFLWSASKHKEVFIYKDKKVVIDSCVRSYQTEPDKNSKAFRSRFKSYCS